MYEAERDPLCYAGTTVLINRAGLRTQAELDDFEFTMFLSRSLEPLPGGQLDYAHYRSIHRHLFQDVYSWAGEPRTIRIAKGGNWFCFPENLNAHMRRTFDWLADHQFLIGLGETQFADSAAYFLAELNAGHPFREGNGRTQFAFLKLLILNAGRGFDDDALDPERTLAAMIQSFGNNLEPLTALIADIVS